MTNIPRNVTYIIDDKHEKSVTQFLKRSPKLFQITNAVSSMTT